MSLNIFKQKTITSIYIWGMFVVFLFVVLFTTLVIYEEYNDFEKEAISIRKHYIAKQKNKIRFDVNRVLKYINFTYEKNHTLVNEKHLQSEVIHAIEQLYGREDGTGYIFIYTMNGLNLSDPLQLHNIGKNLYTFKDAQGVEVIKNLIKTSKQKEGGFVNYSWVKPVTGVATPKISYAKAFLPWQWMVGTGVYLDEVEKLILAEKSALKKRLIKYMMEILSLTVILFGIGLAGLAIVNHIINKEIDTFSRFFKRASKRHITIDEEQIQLSEFKKMVKYINTMVNAIHRRKKKLKEINQTLEKRVEEKTENIRIQNQLLEKEKEFSETLVKAQDNFIKHSIHEINTPLAVIMMHIDMHKIKFGEDKYLSKVEAASKMIANIYDDLSYMVKKDRFVYEKEWISFSLFLEGRIAFFEEIAKGNKHKILSKIDPEINVYFSDIELQRIVDNNLSNAIKYAHKNTDISIVLKKVADTIVLEFITQSTPIEDTKRIFEPFHQEEERVGGFGLGLEIVGSICKKEHVHIEVTSDSEVTIFRYTFRDKREDEDENTFT